MGTDIAERQAAGGSSDALVWTVQCAQGARLHISWGAGHFLKLVDCAREDHTDAAPAGATATALRWYRPSDAMRKVSYDTQPLFQKLQQARSSSRALSAPRSGELIADVRAYSRTVSTVMGRDDDIREPPAPITEAGLESGAPLEEDLTVSWQRALWELLEVFFVDKGSTRDIVTEDLGQWLRRNWAVLGLVSESEASDLSPWADLRDEGASASLGLETHPKYWPSIHRAVALGWTGMAEDLLGMHSAWRRAQLTSGPGGSSAYEPEVGALEAVQSLLRSMPHFCREGSVDITGRAFHDLPEFLHYRQGWVSRCQQFLYMNEFSGTWEECQAASMPTAEGLRTLLQILAGEESTLQAVTHSWLELLVAQILHCYPHLKPQVEFKPVMDRSIDLCSAAPSDPWGSTLVKLLEVAADDDAQTVVAELQRSPGLTPWFLCHVASMLGAAGGEAEAMLQKPLDMHGCSQVESYTLDYAMSLVPYPSTWQLSARYLAWCPAHGVAAMRIMLEKLPLSLRGGDATAVRKAISICSYHGEQLAGVSASLCRGMGMAAWQEGRLGLALEWLMGAHDGHYAGLVVKSLVEQAEAALQNGSTEVPPIPGLEETVALLRGARFSSGDSAHGPGLGAEPQGRHLLEFLIRYHNLYLAVRSTSNDSEESQGGCCCSPGPLPSVRTALLALLEPGVTHHRLWPSVVFKAVPHLEAAKQPLAFSYADTQLLQSRLAESQMACSCSAANGSAAASEMLLHVTRLALVRHLARTHIAECSVTAT